ncbi:hypothetical protein AVEN_102927-1 [Araneus ventricosus]|uniref:Uncharacterized protein n=1 Tax=Araneus ventricosus TaxID=182803 RepID=A0A4Y2MLY0_ARAVE|nr:hypothetical protein AVEN_102927-1 [Araneus ventricosus]
MLKSNAYFKEEFESGDNAANLELGYMNGQLFDSFRKIHVDNEEKSGPYAPFGFESIEKQLWRNKRNDRPISDSEIKAVLSQLFKTGQWMPPAGHVSEDVTSHA